jgi:hypothetical protein
MKSRTKRTERASTRICAAISACMLVVLGLPACSGGALPSARSMVQDKPSTVREQIHVMPSPEPLALGDETSKSLPVEQYEEPDGACSDALYFEEPMASGYVPVADTESLWKACQNQLTECTDTCNRKRKPETRRECFIACNKKYYTCLQLVGLVKATFDAFDAAWSWIENNKGKIVGTVVIIGGVAYIVSTGGSGALILIPLGA